MEKLTVISNELFRKVKCRTENSSKIQEGQFRLRV